MKSAEKIAFVRNEIDEKAAINPSGYFYFEFINIVDTEPTGGIPDEAPVVLSCSDQVSIIKKLGEDGYISIHSIEGEYGAWIEKLPNINLDDYFEDDDDIIVSTEEGTISINKKTGMTTFGKIKFEFNPNSHEFKVLTRIASSKNFQASYEDLLGEKPSKTNIRNLSFVIRNIKKGLGILPENQAINKDVIKNIKGVGYKIAT